MSTNTTTIAAAAAAAAAATAATHRRPTRDPEAADATARPSLWLYGPFSCCAPVEVGDFVPGVTSPNTFATFPLLGPLMFDNENSDARDHCANERTFLASLRLSVYMAVVAVAIALSFHLRSAPTALERQISKPLGLIFWLLSVTSLVAGLGNYIKTINKFSRKAAIVQSGWRTQFIMSFIALSIFGACVALLVVDLSQSAQMRKRHGQLFPATLAE